MDHPPVPSAFDTAQDRADAIDFLNTARAVIARPDAWAPRCEWALDPDGRAVDAHDPLALRWSATAAMRKAARWAGGNAVWLGWKALDHSCGPDFKRFEWAADTTHGDMLQAFDLAIARLCAGPAPGHAADQPETDPSDGSGVHPLAVAVANELTDQALDPIAGYDMAERRGLLLLASSTEREGARRDGVEPAEPDVLRSHVEALKDLDGGQK